MKLIQIRQDTDKQNRLPIAVYSISSVAENISRFFIVEAIVERITKPLFIEARNSLTVRGEEGGVQYVQMCRSSDFECGQKIAGSSNVHISEV
jgi:hypothetical protein